MKRHRGTATGAPLAGEVDVDEAERALMNHRGWCGTPDGQACMGCRQTAIEAVAALRQTGRVSIPDGISSFVDLRKVQDVRHYDIPPDHPLVKLVAEAFREQQCMGTPIEAARVIVAAFMRRGLQASPD